MSFETVFDPYAWFRDTGIELVSCYRVEIKRFDHEVSILNKKTVILISDFVNQFYPSKHSYTVIDNGVYFICNSDLSMLKDQQNIDWIQRIL